MKSVGDRRLRLLSFVYRILIFCLILVGLVLIGGTIYGVFFHVKPPEIKPSDTLLVNGQGQTFTGIGRMRISTKPSAADAQPGMVIVYVSFFFYPEDKAFSEELALRVKDFREIISDYIGSFSVAELHKKGEDDIKSELLRRFNAILRLGKIGALFFSDFMIVGERQVFGEMFSHHRIRVPDNARDAVPVMPKPAVLPLFRLFYQFRRDWIIIDIFKNP
jgi:flagellar basal body-associated protein FliL